MAEMGREPDSGPCGVAPAADGFGTCVSQASVYLLYFVSFFNVLPFFFFL